MGNVTAFLDMYKLNKTESAIFVSFKCALLPEDLMHTFRTLCILDVLFYIAYSARYSLFVLMCRKTHITHSLQRIFIQNFYYFNKFVIREQCYENLQYILTNFFNVLNAQDKRMVKCLEMLSVVQKVQGSKPIKFTSQKQAGISL